MIFHIILTSIAFLACLYGIESGSQSDRWQDVTPTGRTAPHGRSVSASEPVGLGALPSKGPELPWFIAEAQAKR